MASTSTRFIAYHECYLVKKTNETPKQIIMRFTGRKDRDRVWAEKEKIKKCKKEFSSCFFVADLPREVAQERAQLRRIAKRARDILKIKAEARNDKLVLVESNLHYKLEEIPEYLKGVGKTSHELGNLYCHSGCYVGKPLFWAMIVDNFWISLFNVLNLTLCQN